MTSAILLIVGCTGGPPPLLPEAPTRATAGETDADGDGFLGAADCDDADPAVHPDAVDPAGDGRDADCDGSDLDSERIGDGPSRISPVPDSGMRFGFALATGDVDGDGRDELLAGSQNYEDDSGKGPGYAWLLEGPGLEPMWTFGTGSWSEPRSLFLGQDVEIADLTADGQLDLLLREDHTVYILEGPTWPGPDLAGPSVHRITDEGDFILNIHIGVGDVTGGPELDLIASCGDFYGQNEEYGTCVLQGPIRADRPLADADIIVRSRVSYLDTALAGADLDGDGIGELTASAEDLDRRRGGVYVFGGPVPHGMLDTADAAASWFGERPGDWLGMAISDVGDFDGDGVGELTVSAVGWPDGNRRGKVYVLGLDTPSAEAAPIVVEGDPGVHHVGSAIAAGDLDGDGQPDLVLGAPAIEDTVNPGRVLVLFGPLGGVHPAAEADRTWAGEQMGDALGIEVALGDLDGDGATDLLATAMGHDVDGESNVGKVYLLAGPILP